MYMGEHKGNAVYIDLKRNIPLEAKKSKLLDIETARKHNKWTVYLSLLLTTILGSLSFKWISDSGNNGLRIYKISFCISFISSFLLLIIVYRALYKDVRYAKPTTRAVFASAMKGNSAWDANKGYGKVKKRTYLICFLMQLVVLFMLILTCMEGYKYLISGGGTNMFDETKDIILSAVGPGLMTFSTILLWRLNNPIAFFRCASKYQNRKLFDKGVNEIAKKYKEE